MPVLRLDHLVLTVASIQDTCRFYEEVLGMERQIFGDSRTALKFGNQKINLHEDGQEFEPKADHAIAGSADLCFIVDSLAEAESRISQVGFEIIQGRVTRTGATGPITSIYVRDPDGNLIELSVLK